MCQSSVEDAARGDQMLNQAMDARTQASHADPEPEEGVVLREVLGEHGVLDQDKFHDVEKRLIEARDWGALASLCAEVASRAPDPNVGRRLWLMGGFLWLEKLGEPEAAEPLIRRALASDPENHHALSALSAICERARRYDEAADLLGRMVELVPPQDRADALVKLAALVYDHLGQADRAVNALRYAYEQSPTRLDILTRAREIFIKEERWLDAKWVLDDEAASTLEEEGVEPTKEATKTIAESYRLLGVRLLSSATQHVLAEECFNRARALGDKEALSKLDELAHIRNDWAGEVARRRDAGFEARDKKRAADLYLQVAELYHVYGQDRIKTDEYLDRCLILSPGYGPALQFLEWMYQEQERTLDLLPRLNGMAASVRDPNAKVEILLRVASLLERSQDQEKSALEVVNAYRRALAIQPGHRRAVTAATAILRDRADFEGCAQILEGELAAHASEYLKVEAHLELGRIYAEELGDSARARAHFEAVWAHVPLHFEAASALRALYKDAREYPLLLRVLKVLVEYCPDLFSRLEVLHETARVAQEVGEEEKYLAYRSIFELDASAEGVERRFREVAEALSRYQALASSYARVAKTVHKDAGATFWVRAAEVYDRHLPRPRDAIFAYREALKLEPDNQVAHDALEALLRDQDDPQALVEALKVQLAQTQESEKSAIIAGKLGSILDRDLSRLPEAIQMFHRVLEEDDSNGPALESLEDLYRRSEQWSELDGILRRRESLAQTEKERADHRCRRGWVLADRLGEKQQAAELFLEVLGEFPERGEAVLALTKLLEAGVLPCRIAQALERIYAHRGQYGRQMEMLGVIIEQEERSDVRGLAARRGAKIAENRLHDFRGALELAGVALREDPSDEGLRSSFMRLAFESDDFSRAAEILEHILARDGLPASPCQKLRRPLGRSMKDA